MAKKPNNRTFVLLLLTLVYGFNFIDRQIVGILAPFIQADLDLTATQLGLLIGFAFAAFYTIMGIPIALIADKTNRVTLISISLAVWSGFTALTGFAQSFLHIALARVGVGIGEAGGSPPSHSIISDIYKKEERAGALGVYALGIPLGIMSAYFITAALLGADPNTVNWRRIFIILGGTGIVLAVIVKLIVREPERGAMEAKDGKSLKKTPLSQAVPVLLSIPSWWWMCLGIATASFSAYAFSGFQTKFLRELDPEYSFRTIVLTLGVINGVAYAGGTLFGARVVDHWGKTNIRAYGWTPFIAVLLAFPLALSSFWVDSINVHMIIVFGLLTCLGVYLGPSFAIAQTLAPIHIRATSTALFFFVLNMIALGGGPTFAGVMIDYFGNNHEPLQAIRMGMSVVCFSFVLAMFCFFMVTRTIPKDWAEAEKRNEVDLQS